MRATALPSGRAVARIATQGPPSSVSTADTSSLRGNGLPKKVSAPALAAVARSAGLLACVRYWAGHRCIIGQAGETRMRQSAAGKGDLHLDTGAAQ